MRTEDTMALLDDDEIRDRLADLDGWERDGDALRKEFKFDDFPGAGDFASHLRARRNLVVWPEDIGLFAALTGQRAAPARSSGSLEGAVAALLGTYSPQVSYYSAKYPAVASRTPQVRLLALALTDTFAHVAVETFAEMARRYHVWPEAGIDMA